MAIVKDAKDCIEPYPCSGYKVEFVKGIGKVSTSMGISPLIMALGSEHYSNTPKSNYHSATTVSAGGWRDIPAECFKNGRNGSMCDIYAAFYDKETQADSDIKDAVIQAMPKALRDAQTEKVLFNTLQGEINLDRLFSGDRRFLRRRVMDKQNRPVIGLGVPVQANCNISTSIVSIRSVVCAMAVEILEMQGYSVEVYAIAYGTREYHSSGQNDGLQAVRIKPAGETMAQSTILNATSGWAFRTAFFGMIEYAGRSTSGLGHAGEMSETQTEILRDYLPELDDFMVLNCYPNNNNRNEQIKKAVDELVRVVTPYLA